MPTTRTKSVRRLASSLLWGIIVLVASGLSAAPSLSASAAVPPHEYALSLKGVDIHPGERVVGFDIRGKNLTLSQVTHFPNGWTFHIETDPAGNTEVSGGIIVGAAALSPSDVERGWIFRDPPEAFEAPSLSGSISVTKTFADVRDLPLDTRMLVVKPVK